MLPFIGGLGGWITPYPLMGAGRVVVDFFQFTPHCIRFGGTVPTQHNLLLKYSKFKIIGIIMYKYIATTFFFLCCFSFSSATSSDQDLKGKGYGFGFWG